MKNLEMMFERILWIGMDFDNPMQLLYLAAGIALIGLALFLSHAGETGHGKTV